MDQTLDGRRFHALVPLHLPGKPHQACSRRRLLQPKGADRGQMNSLIKPLRFVVGFTLVLAPSTFVGAVVASADDRKDGRVLFDASCADCHATTPEVESYGPNLVALQGRTAGSVGFASDALKSSGIVWTADTLDKFLTDPASQVPGTAMSVAISDPVERSAVVEYIISL